VNTGSTVCRLYGLSAERMRRAAKRSMTIAELAAYLGATTEEMRRLFDSRRRVGFPRFKVGNKWCANLEDVQDWLLAMADELEEH
jgi:excisionase family DNA binding protein